MFVHWLCARCCYDYDCSRVSFQMTLSGLARWHEACRSLCVTAEHDCSRVSFQMTLSGLARWHEACRSLCATAELLVDNTLGLSALLSCLMIDCRHCACCNQSKDVSGTELVSSSLEDVDRDTKLQFEQCAYDCLGKCWPSTADSQGTVLWWSYCLLLSIVAGLE